VIALLAWGTQGARTLPEFATGQTLWTRQSHVNRFYIERATSRVARYLADLKRQRPTMPKSSVLFLSGIPSFVAFQAADGPLVRWAYRDSSLRSYYVTGFTSERARHGPIFFFTVINDTLREQKGTQPLHAAALAMILSQHLDAAHDALSMVLERDPNDRLGQYAMGWLEWEAGDTVRAKQLLAGAGMTVERGPLPELAMVQRLLHDRDTSLASQMLAVMGTKRTLEPAPHMMLSDILLRQPVMQPNGQLEAFAARALDPQNPAVWLRWAIVEVQTNRYVEAEQALLRYQKLGGLDPNTNLYVSAVLEQVRRALPGGDLTQAALRKGVTTPMR